MKEITPGELMDFVNAIHLGHEPRHQPQGRFYLRKGDDERVATGLLSLPPEFKDVIRTSDTQYDVSAVQRQADRRGHLCFAAWHLTVANSPTDTLRIGTEFEVMEPPGVIAWAKVIEVNPSTSVLELRESADETCEAKSLGAAQPLAGG
jgi:hypothetical protein